MLDHCRLTSALQIIRRVIHIIHIISKDQGRLLVHHHEVIFRLMAKVKNTAPRNLLWRGVGSEKYRKEQECWFGRNRNGPLCGYSKQTENRILSKRPPRVSASGPSVVMHCGDDQQVWVLENVWPSSI